MNSPFIWIAINQLIEREGINLKPLGSEEMQSTFGLPSGSLARSQKPPDAWWAVCLAPSAPAVPWPCGDTLPFCCTFLLL